VPMLRMIASVMALIVGLLLLTAVLLPLDTVGEGREDLGSALDATEDQMQMGPSQSGVAPSTSPVPTVDRRFLAGRSVQGRPIWGVELGNPSRGPSLLVVGCIHGNEPAGIAIAKDLAREPIPRQAAVWVLFDMNPDGVARNTRQNARGVDLNRNFPYRWRHIGVPGSTNYSGSRAGSEPETRVAMQLVRRIHPVISIWFHQHMDLVDLSGGNSSVERRYGRLVGLHVMQLPRYPGSVVTWENHAFPGTTSFVVELPLGGPPPSASERFADAALALVHATS